MTESDPREHPDPSASAVPGPASAGEPDDLDFFEYLVGGRQAPPSVLWPTLWTIAICALAAAVWGWYHDTRAVLAGVICAVDLAILWRAWIGLRRRMRTAPG